MPTRVQKGTAAALLSAGILAGAAGTHAVQLLDSTSYVNTGLFSIGRGEGVNFHVTLDDKRNGPPAVVSMRLVDENGTIAAYQDVTLLPGQSTTLSLTTPGVYRAHAQVTQPDMPLGERRAVVSTTEILDLTTAHADRFVCSHDDGAGDGRIAD